jgi:flagellar basal body-associated protein FliL
MFVLILVVLLYVFNIQKNHQNQQKHTKEPPKSTKTYKRTTKINTNIQKTNQNQQKHTKEPPLLYVFVDFGGSFVCLC